MNPVSHYVMLAGQQQGPLSLSQLRSMWISGHVNRETLHFMDGYSEWLPLGYIEEDLDPPQLASRPVYYPPKPSVIPKSRGIYVILGLFLGGLLGIHNFYIGRFLAGVLQLLFTLFSLWTGLWIISWIVAVVWVVLELLIITKDGKGIPLS